MPVPSLDLQEKKGDQVILEYLVYQGKRVNQDQKEAEDYEDEDFGDEYPVEGDIEYGVSGHLGCPVGEKILGEWLPQVPSRREVECMDVTVVGMSHSGDKL